MIWALLTVAVNVVGQVTLKVGMRAGSSITVGFIPLNLSTFAAVGCYGLGLVFWAKALQVMPLSEAYPYMALVLALVPILGVGLLGERLNGFQFASLALVMAGVMLFGFFSSSTGGRIG